MMNDALQTRLPIASWPAEPACNDEFTGGTDPILSTPFGIGETSAAALAAVGLALREPRAGPDQRPIQAPNPARIKVRRLCQDR